jgi:uncharacterized protein
MIEVKNTYKQAELAKRLMNRTSMVEHQGLMFYNEPPKQMSFLMRNARTALDIAFCTSDGVLEEAYPMNEIPQERSTHSLEMNRGRFTKNGINSADLLNPKILKKALPGGESQKEK